MDLEAELKIGRIITYSLNEIGYMIYYDKFHDEYVREITNDEMDEEMILTIEKVYDIMKNQLYIDEGSIIRVLPFKYGCFSEIEDMQTCGCEICSYNLGETLAPSIQVKFKYIPPKM